MKGRDAVVDHSFIDMYPAGEIKQGYRKTIYARRRITTPKIDAVDRATKITKQKVFTFTFTSYLITC